MSKRPSGFKTQEEYNNYMREYRKRMKASEDLSKEHTKQLLELIRSDTPDREEMRQLLALVEQDQKRKARKKRTEDPSLKAYWDGIDYVEHYRHSYYYYINNPGQHVITESYEPRQILTDQH
jgi:hypothetical protein